MVRVTGDRANHIEHLEDAGWFKDKKFDRKREMLVKEFEIMKAKGISSTISRKIKGGRRY